MLTSRGGTEALHGVGGGGAIGKRPLCVRGGDDGRAGGLRPRWGLLSWHLGVRAWEDAGEASSYGACLARPGAGKIRFMTWMPSAAGLGWKEERAS